MLKLKKGLNILSNVLFGILLLFLCSYIVLFILGYHPFAIKTSSMEPEIHQGSIVFVKKLKKDASINDIKEGYDVTYRNGDDVVTHRVFGINTQENILIIRGINGDNPITEFVPFENVIGVAMFSIPHLGYLYFRIANKYFILILVLLAVLSVILKSLFKEFKKTKKKCEEV